MRLRWRRAARTDLRRIGRINSQDSPAAVERVTARIVQTIDLLQDHPGLGRAGRVLETFASLDFGAQDRSVLLKALRLLDENERHQSLRVHAREGDRDGYSSAPASSVLRLTFERLEGGRKRLMTCIRHDDR